MPRSGRSLCAVSERHVALAWPGNALPGQLRSEGDLDWLGVPFLLLLAALFFFGDRVGPWILANTVDGTIFEPGPRLRRIYLAWNRRLGRAIGLFFVALAVYTAVRLFAGDR